MGTVGNSCDLSLRCYHSKLISNSKIYCKIFVFVKNNILHLQYINNLYIKI